MELQRNGLCWINLRVELRSDAGIVNRVRGGLRLRHLNGNFWRKLSELLVCPDWSRRTAFNGAGTAAEKRIDRLLRLIRLRLRNRVEIAGKGVGSAWNHIEPRHWGAEGLNAKQRAGRCTGGNAGVSVNTFGEWTQSTNGS